jgi:hypothetical protein
VFGLHAACAVPAAPSAVPMTDAAMTATAAIGLLILAAIGLSPVR